LKSTPRPMAGRRDLLPFWVTLLVLIGPHPAQAHGTVAAGDFYAGMLHPIIHVEQVLALLGMGLWCGQVKPDRALRTGALFTAAIGIGALCALRGVTLPGIDVCVSASLIVLGAAVAAQVSMVDFYTVPLAALFGAAHGFSLAGGLPTQLRAPLGYTTGIVLTTVLVLFYAARFAQRFQAFAIQVGVRIVGSWIAATGLILLALRLRA